MFQVGIQDLHNQAKKLQLHFNTCVHVHKLQSSSSGVMIASLSDENKVTFHTFSFYTCGYDVLLTTYKFTPPG